MKKNKKREKRGGEQIQKKISAPPSPLFSSALFCSLFPHFISQTLPKERE
jgi:hypothetical protein